MATPSSEKLARRERRIGIFVYDGVMALDAVGPADVFGLANVMCRVEDPAAGREYDVCFVASRRGPISTVTGFRLTADFSIEDANTAFDTLIVPGSYEDRYADAILALPKVVPWLRRALRLEPECRGREPAIHRHRGNPGHGVAART